MKRERIAGLDCYLAGGTDRDGGGDGPVVVLLHGFGAPGEDLVPLWRVMDVPEEVRFVFPAAPLGLEIPFADARAWWMIDLVAIERSVAAGKPLELGQLPHPGMPEARAKVTALVEALGERGRPSSRMVLGGFSQGAMLACDVMLHSTLPFAGLALLSGSIANEDEWTPLLQARRGLHVYQSHGEYDPILPHAAAVKLKNVMQAAGLLVEWVSFPGGHEIPNRALDGLAAFVSTLFATTRRESL